MKRTLLLLLAGVILLGCKAEKAGNIDLKLNHQTLAMKLMQVSSLSVVESEYSSSSDLVWTSLNPEIASVDREGNVTAVAPGVTKIYAFVSGLNAVRGECEVTVNDKLESELTIDAMPSELMVGSEVRLNYAYSPSIAASLMRVDIVTSDSVGQRLAQVRIDKETGELVILALKPGYMMVKLVNKVDTSVNSSVTFTITDVAIDSMKFTKVENDNIEIEAGKTLNLGLEIAPKAASYRSVYWKSSNTAVVTVNQEGLIAAVGGNGSAQISASTPDGKQIICNVNVKPIGGDLRFAKDTIIVTGNTTAQKITLNLSTAPTLASVTVRTDNSYAPETGTRAFVTIRDNNTAQYSYASSQVGTDRIIAESVKDGKAIKDTCYVIIKDISDALLKCNATYAGVELGAKTVFTAKFANFTNSIATLTKVELILIKYSKVKSPKTEKMVTVEDWKIIETLNNLGKSVDAISGTSVDFVQVPFTPITVVSPRSDYRLRYTYTVGSATNTVVRSITADNGAAFAPAK